MLLREISWTSGTRRCSGDAGDADISVAVVRIHLGRKGFFFFNFFSSTYFLCKIVRIAEVHISIPLFLLIFIYKKVD